MNQPSHPRFAAEQQRQLKNDLGLLEAQILALERALPLCASLCRP